uniref:Uncharacterized protein n=1 Tax=Caenorhabditis japonica TaxID=281687 RepID=A0A8R1EQP0_CAEJA
MICQPVPEDQDRRCPIRQQMWPSAKGKMSSNGDDLD